MRNLLKNFLCRESQKKGIFGETVTDDPNHCVTHEMKVNGLRNL